MDDLRVVSAAFVVIAVAAALTLAIAAIAAPTVPGGSFWLRFSSRFSFCRCAYIPLANSGDPAKAIAAADTKPGRKTIGIGEIGKYLRCSRAFRES